MKPDGA